jgi:hypothetical protein
VSTSLRPSPGVKPLSEPLLAQPCGAMGSWSGWRGGGRRCGSAYGLQVSACAAEREGDGVARTLFSHRTFVGPYSHPRDVRMAVRVSGVGGARAVCRGVSHEEPSGIARRQPGLPLPRWRLVIGKQGASRPVLRAWCTSVGAAANWGKHSTGCIISPTLRAYAIPRAAVVQAQHTQKAQEVTVSESGPIPHHRLIQPPTLRRALG